ncbi:MAG: T9SS type A sorting domain-containing protein [Paludibacter sp.]
MGGLMFIAHQDGGYIWVFDVNPSVNNDFAYVGKYKTNRSESCDLSFDNSTGLLYILHNVSDNYLEVNDLHTSVSSSEYKFSIIKEYYIPNPASGSNNIEGFAISPKFPDVATQNAWLCRDVNKDTEIIDAIKWFSPFSGEGTNLQTEISSPTVNTNFVIQQFSDQIILKSSNTESINNIINVQVFNALGKSVFKKLDTSIPCNISLKNSNSGIYFITISNQNDQSQVLKFIKR